MPKERNLNPVQAHHKATKASALKKSKQEQRSRQNEKLARRNPERIQRQIDDLKALEGGGGGGGGGAGLRPKDKQTLEQLEKDLGLVKRAREALGDKAPEFGRGGGGGGGGRDGGAGAGARNRDGKSDRKRRREEDESETDEEVRNIPMPRDTPPPLPRRRNDHTANNKATDNALPNKTVAPAQTVYSSAPVIRDLARESKRFVPAAVAQNLARVKGQGGRLLEEDELERLERAGYRDAAGAAEEAEKEAEFNVMNRLVEKGVTDGGAVGDEVEGELRRVEMEEVPDEDL